ncbi:hypothetical protein [Cupriavidus alkaliphilus]|uniref:hypothetical protein n=1 Tax=Cupriavidus alkaliphilus TaxID=942866 RepID=UPI00161B9674|nr:hypothetical protein [Cupriavidus alkaliphilus]MBB2918319.1 hypothetical protein [Cupriavidus alkaliphilus]
MNSIRKSKLGFELHPGDVVPNEPLLYLIEVIDGSTGEIDVVYVGKSNRGSSRPFTAYDNNIRRMIAGDPPRNGKEFRPIHHRLFDAYHAGQRVCIRLVKNVPADTILIEERLLQIHYGLFFD